MASKARQKLPVLVLARPLPFAVQWSEPASHELAELAQRPANAKSLANCVAAIAQFATLGTVPRCVNSNRALQRNWLGCYRLQVDGDWRVIYSVHPHAKVIRVERIGKRWQYPEKKGRDRGSIYGTLRNKSGKR